MRASTTAPAKSTGIIDKTIPANEPIRITSIGTSAPPPMSIGFKMPALALPTTVICEKEPRWTCWQPSRHILHHGLGKLRTFHLGSTLHLASQIVSHCFLADGDHQAVAQDIGRLEPAHVIEHHGPG